MAAARAGRTLLGPSVPGLTASTRAYRLKANNIPLAKYGGRHTVTMLPGDGIGPEM